MDVVAALGVPRVRVAVLDPHIIRSELEIVTDAGVVIQSLVVTGLLD